MGILAVVTVACLVLQAYHYAGYPLLVAVAARIRRRPAPLRPAVWPPATLVVSAFNEAGLVARKLANALALDYPGLEILLVADGSTDGTERAAEAFAAGHPPIRVLFEPARRGKAAAMNRGAAAAKGEILVFSDANAFYAPDALKALVARFGDPRVAVVSGSKTVRAETPEGEGPVAASEGLYWRYETLIRRSESDLGSTVAVVGEILAIRRSDWRPIPAGTVNDDAWIAMTSLASGRAVLFAPDALSWEAPSASTRIERTRRRRINAGRLKLLATPGVWPWRRPAVLAAFVSHKVMRLMLPFLMFGGFVANLAAVVVDPGRSLLVATLAAQLAFFLLAASAVYAERTGRRWRLARLGLHLVESNLAVLEAVFDLCRGRSFTVWEKPAR